MEEISKEAVYGERTNESLEEITELTLGDESWSELLDTSEFLNIESKCRWGEEVPLSEELRKLDEEQKQQIAEARAWIEEEEAMDEILRKDIAELQLAKQKNHEEAMDEILRKDIADLHLSKQASELRSSLGIPVIPPEAEKKILELENKVKNLQDQLDEKTVKVAQVSDLYSELLNKLNESRERSLATDREFKASFARIKEDYAEVEALLKSEIDRYKGAAKQLEFKVTEKELEVNDLRQDKEELIKSKTDLETKCNESSTSLESLNKYVLKLKVQLKNIKTERDSLKKEMINVEDIDVIKQRLSQIEEERNALLKEKENAEDLESLRNRLTLLEEEKEAAAMTQKEYADLENSFAELKNSAAMLKNENERIVANYEKAERKIKDQQIIIDRFLKSAQESEEQKIIAVMRSVELEEQLSFKDKEISQLKEGITKLEIPREESSFYSHHIGTEENITTLQSSNYELIDKIKLLEEEKNNNLRFIENLKEQLVSIESSLRGFQNENLNLLAIIDGLSSEKNDLVKDLTAAKLREDQLRREMTLSTRSGTSPAPIPGSESDPLYQKFKKVVANYKLKTKLCHELEDKLENARSELADKEEIISRILTEKQQIEEQLSKSNIHLDELNNSIEIKSFKIKELITVIEQICNIDGGILNEEVDTTILSDMVEKCKLAKEADIQMVQQQMAQMNSVLMNVAKLEGELDELRKSLKEKDEAISELEVEREKLSDVVKLNEKELEMLRSMYEKVSEKNEHFYTDLMSIEKEMANGKTELLSRLEVVTQNYDKCLSNLQERENYIETLEQDIVTMKTKMYNIESGMDERHRTLKETSDQLMAKFQAAEIMSQTFEKYKSEVETKIETLEGQKKKAEENELLLKEFVLKLEADREFIIQENENHANRIELLMKEKEGAESSIKTMSTELDNLRDIRNSYNTTLDKIEELNSELTQTTLSFEIKNQRLEMLEQERMELVNKLTDLEDAYSDLEGKLEESIEKNSNLESEISLKAENLEKVEQERLAVINKLSDLENTCALLGKKLEESSHANSNLISDLNVKIQQLEMLEREKNEFIEKFTTMENTCIDFGRRFQECTAKSNDFENELIVKSKHLSEANQKLFDLQTQLVESEAMCASFQDELHKMEKDLEQLNILKEENKRLDDLLKAKKDEVVEHPQVVAISENKLETQAMSVFTWNDQGATGSTTLDNPFGDIKDEEDGWGWMAQEAALEHDHKHSEALKIQELTTKLSKVTEERDHYLNELNATKTKCQKLMKKIKEIKTINENLERSKSDIKVGFSDLDFALQEEFRAENDKLQAKLSELNTQLATLKNEKDSMSKRLDTLISANDQLIDLKERQDLEVQMWQKKSNQLMNEVKFLKSSLETKEGNLDDEMPDKITALINENDELKLILESKKRELEATAKEIDLELPEKFAALSCENEELTALLNVQKRDQEIKLCEYIEKVETLNSEKQALLQTLQMKDHHIQELSLKIVDPDLPVKYNALSAEYENIKLLLNLKETELSELIKQQKEQLEVRRNIVDFSQQTDTVEEVPLNRQEENVQNLRLFSFDNQQDDAFSRDLQVNRELEELRARVQTMTEERVNFENYIARLEDELQHVRGAEEEALLKAGRDRDDLYGHLEDSKLESALWRQKADELMKEVEVKEEMYYNVLKDKEEAYQQGLLAKDEDNACLVNTLNAKEQSVKELTDEIEKLKAESERMKNVYTASKEALEEEVKKLTTEFTLSREPSSVDDNTNFLNQIIGDLQKRLDDTVKDNIGKDTLINTLQQEIVNLENKDEQLDNLEQEKLIVETILKERQSEVDSLRQELTTLMKRKAETQEHEHVELILNEKDNEIGRLTKAVVDMQERLLRMEEGKLMASVHDLQKRLDRTLYTLHNRDVRCEELTQEIMQLLEERDTLQFRLAEALRSINSLSCNKEDTASSSSSPVHISNQSHSSPVNEKLHKLRHEYRRDPTVQIETESRHMQHMQLYSHQQSTSATEEANSSADYGFFNWFFGGSPQTASSVQPESHADET